jgi:hypothetical protein
MLWFGYGVEAEIGPLVGLGLYATSYTLQVILNMVQTIWTLSTVEFKFGVSKRGI